MTRREWVRQNIPGNVDDSKWDGAYGCPHFSCYSELQKIDPSIPNTCLCITGPRNCTECWNTEIPETIKTRTFTPEAKPSHSNCEHCSHHSVCKYKDAYASLNGALRTEFNRLNGTSDPFVYHEIGCPMFELKYTKARGV